MGASYLLDIAILLAAAVVAIPIFRALKLGVVPGFLVAGVLVGPSVLALIDNVTAISQLAELGVALLLFVIGIELKPSRLWRMRRMVFGLGTLQVAITGTLIALGAYFLLGTSAPAAVVIGPALALSSTAFVIQLLAEKKSLYSEYGRASLAILLLQDVAVVPLLALVPLLAMPELTIGTDIAIVFLETVAILLVVIVGGRYLLQPVFNLVARTGSSEAFTALTVLLVLGTALLTEHLGLSMAMGAFIAGLLIADSPFRHEISAEMQPFRGLLLGLFFMSMGMSLDISQFLVQPIVTLAMVAGLIAFKFIILWPLVMAFGLPGKTGAAVAILLAQSGEFGLVLFAYAFQSGLLETVLFQQLLLVVVLSMLATPPLAYVARRLASSRPPPQVEHTETPPKAPIVLAGFGRVGRRVGQLLSSAGLNYVAVDGNASLVMQDRENDYPVFFGDARRPDVLRSVGAADADLVIVTLNDFDAAEDLVASLHSAYPDVAILVRGRDADQCKRLRDLGARFAVSENLEASLDLARETLNSRFGVPERTEELLSRYRDDYYAGLDENPEPPPSK